MKGKWNKFVWDKFLYDFHGETDGEGKPFPPDGWRTKHVFLCHESLSPYQFVQKAKGVFHVPEEAEEPDVIFVHKNDWGWLPKARYTVFERVGPFS